MEEKLDEIIALLTQLPDTLRSFITSNSEDETEQLEEDEQDESETKEKDLGMDYLDF